MQLLRSKLVEMIQEVSLKSSSSPHSFEEVRPRSTMREGCTCGHAALGRINNYGGVSQSDSRSTVAQKPLSC
jgi:hypothetical protein